MGIYLKNAFNKAVVMGPYKEFTNNQIELKKLLEQIWNNQDFLNKEDYKQLKHLSEKGI